LKTVARIKILKLKLDRKKVIKGKKRNPLKMVFEKLSPLFFVDSATTNIRRILSPGDQRVKDCQLNRNEPVFYAIMNRFYLWK
jgi:hypothetical protein